MITVSIICVQITIKKFFQKFAKPNDLDYSLTSDIVSKISKRVNFISKFYLL